MLYNVSLLTNPFSLGGVGGSCRVTHRGHLSCLPKLNNMNLAYYAPSIPVNLFSLGHLQRCGVYCRRADEFDGTVLGLGRPPFKVGFQCPAGCLAVLEVMFDTPRSDQVRPRLSEQAGGFPRVGDLRQGLAVRNHGG